MKYYLLFFIKLFAVYYMQAQKKNDTVFLVKEKTQQIFIDKSANPEFILPITDFSFTDTDSLSYTTSVQQLKDMGFVFKKVNINNFPKQWIILREYENDLYTYHPCDFLNHYKVEITDTSVIEHTGEGPIANGIKSYKRGSSNSAIFYLVDVNGLSKRLNISIINKAKGIINCRVIFSDKTTECFYMIDKSKVNQQPTIVNNTQLHKHREWIFDNTNCKN